MVDEFDGDEYELRRRRRRRPDAAVPDREPRRRRPRRRPVQRRRAWRRSSPTSPTRSTHRARARSAAAGGCPRRSTDARQGGRRRVTSTDAADAGPRPPGVDRRARRRRRRASSRRRPPALVAERLGEDVGRLDGVLDTLAATLRRAARQLRPADVEPFLGEAGGVPPWDLTDAIDGGDTTRRSTCWPDDAAPGERHPLQVMAILHGHYSRLARLDGVDVAHARPQAAAVLGIKPGFPARKALDQYRRLGGDGGAPGDRPARRGRPRPARRARTSTTTS